MQVVLFDDQNRDHLLPLTFTRPTAELRLGIWTIAEKWQHCLPGTYSYATQDYLQKKYPLQAEGEALFINGGLCPNDGLLAEIESLRTGQYLMAEDTVLAARTSPKDFNLSAPPTHQRTAEQTFRLITRPYDLFAMNAAEMELDFERITAGRQSAAVHPSNQIIGSRFFAEEDAQAYCATFNSTSGPIYLGKGSEVMEGSHIRGGFSLGEKSVLKMSAKIYGATTIGPYCKVGGEVNNSVFQGYANKGHDGFLGNAVIGAWCNLGADTNNSNLKNNYDEVRVWSYVKQGFERTGLQFCGLIMGDHSKTGINTMFNTGTVVGVSANVFGSGFPRNYIPSFSWGGAAGFSEYKFDKALATAKRVMERRQIPLDAVERDILQAIFDKSAAQR